MLSVRDVHKHFRAAAWATPQEMDTFAAETGPLAPDELVKLLSVLSDKAVAADGRHASRCRAFVRLADLALSPELFVPLVRALRLPDPTLRSAIVPLVPKVNSVSKHGELCQLLAQPDGELRKLGAALLRQLAGPAAFEVLRELVKDKGFAGRVEAMDALVPKAGHHAIPLLTAILQSGSTAERVHALRYLGDPRAMAKDVASAMRAITSLLGESDLQVLSEVLGALASLAPEDEFYKAVAPHLEGAHVGRIKAIVGAVARYASPRTVAFLTDTFRAGPTAIRLVVLDTLLAMGGEPVLPLILEALGHRRLDVRTRAAEVLVSLSAKGEVDPARIIVWLLRSRDVTMRRMAVELARKIGDASGELGPKLLKYLRDEDWWVRERVMDALAEIAGPTLTQHLVAYLQDPSPVVRRFAIGGMGRLKDPRAIGALVRSALQDSDWWIREEAVQAIAALGDARAVPYLLQFLGAHPQERVACIEALTTLGAKDAVPRFVELLEDPDADVRLAAVRACGKLGDASLANAMAPRAKDEVYRVRAVANEILVRWNVVAQLTKGANDPSLNVLDRLLVAVSQAGADDLLIASGRPVYMKRLGKMEVLSQTVFNAEQVKLILLPHLSAAQLADLEAEHDIDFSYEVKTHALRFRAHVFRQMTGLAAVLRTVKNEIVPLDKLGVPAVVRSFGDFKNGLVLVGGPTGSGKSTTLAALIDHINRARGLHIVTIEDPIEVVHARVQSLINQREVGAHTASFARALRSTLRQDPDVLLVGEMRDLETISFAVSAAETGHLVFGTVHTVSADTSVDRLVNAFPPGQQPQVRAMLADTLRAVICQQLLRRADGPGRALAVEVMINNDAVSNMIRKGKTFQIQSVVTTSRDLGMQSMDSELIRLVKAGVVSRDDAYMKAIDKKAFEAGFAQPAGPAARPGDGRSVAPAPAPAQPGGHAASAVIQRESVAPVRSRQG